MTDFREMIRTDSEIFLWLEINSANRQPNNINLWSSLLSLSGASLLFSGNDLGRDAMECSSTCIEHRLNQRVHRSLGKSRLISLSFSPMRLGEGGPSNGGK